MMNEDPEWITVLSYENLTGRPTPKQALVD